MAGILLGKGLGFLEGFEVVGLSFAIPLFERAKSSSRDDDRYGLSILGVHQALLLEVWEQLTLHLHVGVRDQLSGRYLFAGNNARFGHIGWISNAGEYNRGQDSCPASCVKLEAYATSCSQTLVFFLCDRRRSYRGDFGERASGSRIQFA